MITGLFYNKGYDPLEKGMATQSSILAWGIPWAEEPGYNSRGLSNLDSFYFFFLSACCGQNFQNYVE